MKRKSFSLILLFFALLLFVAIAVVVRDDLGRQGKIDVVVITVESLRNDMVIEENCPNLLLAAKDGLRFTNYRANSGWTGTNIVTLLSGLTPFESGVHTRGQSVAKETLLPLDQLAASGYTVAGLQPFMAMDIYQNLGVSIDSYSPDPLVWMARQRLDGNPFFLWFHYVHTHLPYTGHPEGEKGALPHRLKKITTATAVHADEETYTRDDIPAIHELQQQNIREFDSWFQSLYQLYRSGGLYRDTILIVTADHGDEHGERGMVGHASTTLEGHLHEEIVHIPFFVWLPDKLRTAPPDTTVPASHVDVMPSVMRLLGVRPSLSLHGQDFLSGADNRLIWTSMTSSGGFAEPDPAAIRYFEYATVDGNWKLRLRQYSQIQREETFLYDLSSDPDETKNIAEEHPQRTQWMRTALEAFIGQRTSRPIRLVEEQDNIDGTALQWLHPRSSRRISYDSVDGKFYLEWSGSPDRSYLVEYRAGHGAKVIQGTLEVTGNRKDFGRISRLYWDTWIVANSPFSIRVKEEGGLFGPWLQLEAVP